MPSINPHLHFNGNTEEAFLFYKTVFGGEIKKIIRFKELSTEGFSFPEEELNKIMHIALPIGVGSAIMGSDVPSMLGVVNENEKKFVKEKKKEQKVISESKSIDEKTKDKVKEAFKI